MKPKLLITDDDASYAGNVANYFKLNGFDTRTALSPEECIAEIERDVPDVVILDIRFPPKFGIEGIETCQKIKSNPSTRSVLVVLRTSYGDVDADEGLKAGADAFFFEPTNLNILKVHIQTLLQARDSAYEVARLKAEEELSAGFAHDLNNMLAIPFIAIGMLEAGEPLPLTSIVDAAKEGMLSAQRLMEASRARGLGNDAIECINVSLLINECVELRRKTCMNKGVPLLVEPIESDIPAVKVRKWELVFSLIELVNNALRAFEVCKKMHAAINQPRIVMSARVEHGGRVNLSVSDNGPGISDHLKGKIFQQGFTTRKEVGGTGWGLWLVRKRLEEFDGVISFEANNPQGTIFNVSLLAC